MKELKEFNITKSIQRTLVSLDVEVISSFFYRPITCNGLLFRIFVKQHIKCDLWLWNTPLIFSHVKLQFPISGDRVQGRSDCPVPPV
jgi:hypothetical protein